MESLLSFFSDMILFTAGIAVALLWVIIFGAIAIEIFDLVTGKHKSTDPYEEI